MTYSKVREITRVADELATAEQTRQAEERKQATQADPDQSEPGVERAEATVPTGLEDLNEAGLVELAQACTASQLARTVSGWRAARGTSRQRRSRQRVSWVIREDGNVQFTAVLPPEEGAALIAAVQAATDANTDPEPIAGQQIPDDEVSELARDERVQRTRVEALTEIATHYLGSLPEDRSGEDRTMVVIEINAEALAAERGDAERDRAERDRAEPDASEPDPRDSSNDATESPAEQRSRGNADTPITVPTCRVRGGAALEASDARRAACDSTLLGVIIDQKGMPLAVGRQERLVTRHRRRALMIRDGGCCQFPGCGRTRHLKAHHRISWLSGGRTDLENLILLCQSHHTRVHEDHLAITVCDDPDCGVRWRFCRPDGTTISPSIAGLDAPCPWRPGRDPAFRAANDQLVADWEIKLQALQEQAARLRTAYQHIHDTRHPDANRVFPVGGGEGFLLANCVDALFAFTEPHPALVPAA